MSTCYLAGIIILAVMLSGGVGAWAYALINYSRQAQITAPAAPSEYLLEAMREVDAMLPGTTPIALPKEPEAGTPVNMAEPWHRIRQEMVHECEQANQRQNAAFLRQADVQAANLQNQLMSAYLATQQRQGTFRTLTYARYIPAQFGWILEDGTFLDEMEHDADPSKALHRAALAHLVHLRSIGVPI